MEESDTDATFKESVQLYMWQGRDARDGLMLGGRRGVTEFWRGQASVCSLSLNKHKIFFQLGDFGINDSCSIKK